VKTRASRRRWAVRMTCWQRWQSQPGLGRARGMACAGDVVSPGGLGLAVRVGEIVIGRSEGG
jgi:hypothetical protein